MQTLKLFHLMLPPPTSRSHVWTSHSRLSRAQYEIPVNEDLVSTYENIKLATWWWKKSTARRHVGFKMADKPNQLDS